MFLTLGLEVQHAYDEWKFGEGQAQFDFEFFISTERNSIDNVFLISVENSSTDSAMPDVFSSQMISIRRMAHFLEFDSKVGLETCT